MLPAELLVPALLEALSTHGAAVVVAPPGTGKSTILPPALLDAGALGDGRLVMLQPRRVAARAVARRIASQRGTALGEEIGYRVRFEDRTSARTRIEVVTEGLLTRRLQSDPFLEGVSCVVLDEFHERSLHADLALALLADVRREVRPDLKIVVMSATLDPGPVAAFLGDCPVLVADGRLHPVAVSLETVVSQEPVVERAARAVRRCLAEPVNDTRPPESFAAPPGSFAAPPGWRPPDATPGHILVFLPGRGEIADLTGLLGDLGPDVLVLPLHGGLTPEAQDRALQPPPRPGMRKIVLATNIAETSVTIEGVETVIDTGLARVPRFEPRLGLERLERVRISRASADQRAGRAGRTGPGRCLRLWTSLEHAALAPSDVPELQRTDLARTLLEIRSWGADPRTFRFFEAPDPAAIEQAEGVLRRLGQVDDRGVTPAGKAALALPLHPRMAAVVAAGERLGVLREVATAAALLNERDILREKPDLVADSDLTLRLDALEACSQANFRADVCRRFGLDAVAAREVLRVREQILHAVGDRHASGLAPHGQARGDRADRRDARDPREIETRVLRSLLAGYGDRVAQRRTPRGTKLKLAGGGGATLDKRSVVHEAELLLAVSLEAGLHGRGEHRVTIASAIDRAWLTTTRELETRWDAERAGVVQSLADRFLELTLAQHPAGDAADPTVASALLAERAAAEPERAFDISAPATESFLSRVRFLAEHLPEQGFPDFAELRTGRAEQADGAERSGRAVPTWIQAVAVGRRTFDDLRRVELTTWLRAELTPAQQTALDRHAPERFPLPAGRAGRLTYIPGEPPVLAAKIQHFFGLERTPTVADGRVRVRLHLLAPNGRPAQVTQDLESFWKNTWPLVRKELRGRYPKHAWPEDPRTAWPDAEPGKG